MEKMMSEHKIPLAVPDLTSFEEEYVMNAIRSTWISSTGEYVQRFEKLFAELCGTRTAIGVCNGTVALHLALLALDVRPGDEVLVPALTYIATANAVRYVGAEPIFVDVDPDTWCIDPNLLENNITRRTRGIIAVHLYGHPADMDLINHIAGIHGLWVIEDAAEFDQPDIRIVHQVAWHRWQPSRSMAIRFSHPAKVAQSRLMIQILNCAYALFGGKGLTRIAGTIFQLRVTIFA